MVGQASAQAPGISYQRVHPYDRWIESLNVPIYRAYYIEDLRTLELGYWDRRGCDVAFLQLAGQEGVSGAWVEEIPAGKTLEPFKLAIDDLVYVVSGRGITSIWAEDKPKRTFEWQAHGMFLLPANYSYQTSNVQGNQPVRLLHTNGLPTAMTALPNPEFYFNTDFVDLSILYGSGDGDFYSEAKVARDTSGNFRNIWVGNFFPDMLAWDHLDRFERRGAGGRVVWVTFPTSIHGSHMSVFPARTYKKGHRHGPGVVIVIPAGEGFSVMWQDKQERVVVPWHEGSVFVPPNRWWHQHFNAGAEPARYVALHAPTGMPTGAASFTSTSGERITNREEDQIEYPDEDPWIRQHFEGELAKRGLTTLMPEQAYRDRAYEWKYADGE